MSMLNAGVNFIKMDSGIELPVFYSSGQNKKSKVLWILFSAGGPRRKLKQFYPLFDRISWVTNQFSGPCLIFEDPSYHYNVGIQDGWYLGDYERPYYEMIIDVIANITKEWSLPYEALRFFGSSTGGTAAIWVSDKFPGSVCIASNPQIDISIWPTYDATCQILKHKNVQSNWANNVKSMVQNLNHRLFISINLADKYDKIQAQQLFSYIENGSEQPVLQMKEGIFHINNKFIWFYHVKPKINNPHNILPLFGMLIGIESLFFHKQSPEMINRSFLVYRELLSDYYQLYDSILEKGI